MTENPPAEQTNTQNAKLSKEGLKEKVKTILPERKQIDIENAHNHDVFSLSDPIKILLTFALLIILFAIAFFLSYLNTQRQIFEKQVKEDVVPEAEIKLPKITDVESNETSNWKTHTDKMYGFSIKYPSEWNTKAENIPGGPSEVQLTPDPVEYQQSQGVTIKVTENTKQLTSREYFDQEILPGQEGSVCKNFNINSNVPETLTEFDVIIVEGLCGIFNQGPRTIIIKNNLVFDISSGFTESNTNLVYQILSTFQFTN